MLLMFYPWPTAVDSEIGDDIGHMQVRKYAQFKDIYNVNV